MLEQSQGKLIRHSRSCDEEDKISDYCILVQEKSWEMIQDSSKNQNTRAVGLEEAVRRCL